MMKNGNDHEFNTMIEYVKKILDSAKTYDKETISNQIMDCVPEYSPDLTLIDRKIKKTIFDEKQFFFNLFTDFCSNNLWSIFLYRKQS